MAGCVFDHLDECEADAVRRADKVAQRWIGAKDKGRAIRIDHAFHHDERIGNRSLARHLLQHEPAQFVGKGDAAQNDHVRLGLLSEKAEQQQRGQRAAGLAARP
jgi:hypothetical protein